MLAETEEERFFSQNSHLDRKSQSKPIYPERCFRVEVEG
jgi:hypothetical protein